MDNGIVEFTLNDLLNYIKPVHLVLVVLIVLLLAIWFSSAVVFHLNTYREYREKTVFAERTYLSGVTVLFSLAFIFLILFSI